MARPEPDDPDRFRITVTFDEQADGKTVLTMRQLHPSRERRQVVIGFRRGGIRNADAGRPRRLAEWRSAARLGGHASGHSAHRRALCSSATRRISGARRRVMRVRWSGAVSRGRKKLAGNGGEGGIRTLDRLAPMPHFECGTINHSATSPGRRREARRVVSDLLGETVEGYKCLDGVPDDKKCKMACRAHRPDTAKSCVTTIGTRPACDGHVSRVRMQHRTHSPCAFLSVRSTRPSL